MESSSDSQRVLRVVAVDDSPDLRLMTRTIISFEPDMECVGEASDGFEAVEVAEQLHPDIMLMDVSMPRCSGAEAARIIHERYPDIKILAWTGHVDSEHVVEMIVAGACGYVVKGSSPTEIPNKIRLAASTQTVIDSSALPGLLESVTELARAEQSRRAEAERLNEQLQQAYRQTINSLVVALRCKDGETEGHTDRVVDLATLTGQKMKLSEKQQQQLEWGALFHDIGKIGMPDAILHNTDELSEDEWQIVKQHTITGERIIKQISFLAGVDQIVRHSHEHWDGSGYPDNLKGREIPLLSRIILACDAFDAMTAERTYQSALTIRQAHDRLQELSGKVFDPDVVKALSAVIRETMPQEFEAPETAKV